MHVELKCNRIPERCRHGRLLLVPFDDLDPPNCVSSLSWALDLEI